MLNCIFLLYMVVKKLIYLRLESIKLIIAQTPESIVAEETTAVSKSQ
ncbi:hypothetical protein CUPA0034 [Campylobacter upsaliensis RM3195]|nr:hypothetical protein CUPA0034 [Campylobacter upsaliensis RM3195]